MQSDPNVDVLIVGAGAAGLTLAVDLARRGVTFRLIDRLDGPFQGSRGKGIQPRTLEVFEDLGIVDRIAAVGSPYPTQRVYGIDGGFKDVQEFSNVPMTDAEPYGMPLLVPQFRTEAVLRDRLVELGGRVEYGVGLVSVVDDGGGIVAGVAGLEGRQTIRCQYLIGADGGRSFIRRALAVEFPGKTLGVRAIVADIEIDGLGRDVWHRFNEGDMARQISFCPLPHGDVFQLQAPIALDGDVDLSVAGVQAFIDERLPTPAIRVRAVHWASAYAMNARLAERYRVGNIFLVGDAAHIHPPTGGQGLNTSVQDAYNLGWKLAAVLAGAPETLLDTYEEERRPIAAAMLGLATGLLDKAKHGDMRRGRDVRQLDLGYRGSSLAFRTKLADGIQPGDRMPDAVLQGAAGQPRRLYDLLAGPHWTMLAAGNADEPARPGLNVVTIGREGQLLNGNGQLGLATGERRLIRPDGYVGGRFSADETDAITRYLAQVLPPHRS
ncbi:FAD-dependent oxidoreductase [Sphingomonas sp. OK281]|uniref:FAD-dependent oxidoreductase n=1 Tax=Sphingomonas sp. OK281 TaxID=1881067 RepID=UPI0008EC78A6|nr:FAD-dependent oxidoreductase [Sphingomonas sp. OK281]SFN85541.1 2-polyprenyl-6-methoxyphenol hydroxylase [Sphingomonas sp. OK281]